MERVCSAGFDVSSFWGAPKPVYVFRDWFGRKWMAEHRWSIFRVSTDGVDE